jgi:hypothetical protein
MRVRVITLDTRSYPACPPVGTEGVVSKVHSNGLKSAVDVTFLDSDRPVRIAGRMLKVVKP